MISITDSRSGHQGCRAYQQHRKGTLVAWENEHVKETTCKDVLLFIDNICNVTSRDLWRYTGPLDFFWAYILGSSASRAYPGHCNAGWRSRAVLEVCSNSHVVGHIIWAHNPRTIIWYSSIHLRHIAWFSSTSEGSSLPAVGVLRGKRREFYVREVLAFGLESNGRVVNTWVLAVCTWAHEHTRIANLVRTSPLH